MSLPTLTFRTLCTDPRCVSVQRCQRAEHERYGDAPGENYGPRCVPAPALDLASGAASVYALGVEEGERRAQEAFRADIERYGSQLEAAHGRGERQATERIVAWLREPGEYVDPACSRLADCIEQGEHLRSSEGEK